jgi:hypothetical protein
MAKVNNVRLKIDPTNNSKLYRVSVSFRLNFNQSDYGKKFQYSIRLRRADYAVGEPPDGLPAVLYRFKFGNKNTKTITGSPFTTADPTKITRNVSAELLNEDPFSHPIDRNGGTAPNEDEMFASVRLMTGGGPFVQFLDEKYSNIETVTIE